MVLEVKGTFSDTTGCPEAVYGTRREYVAVGSTVLAALDGGN